MVRSACPMVRMPNASRLRWPSRVGVVLVALACLLGPLAVPAHAQKGIGKGSPQRFTFNIAPNTPLTELLPEAPVGFAAPLPWLVDELTQVPEVLFEKLGPTTGGLAEERVAHAIAKINHVNQKGMDQFMTELRARRPDLAGLPFAMGETCRQGKDRRWVFGQELALVRVAMPGGVGVAMPGGMGVNGSPIPEQPLDAKAFWSKYAAVRQNLLRDVPAGVKADAQEDARARIAALMQVMGPERQAVQTGLVEHLAGIAHPEATRALLRLAVFSFDQDIRRPALAALEGRAKADCTDVLLAGLRYPWPAIARNAGDAIVQLRRSDLVPQLVAILDEPDPRAPIDIEVNGKKTRAVRELVRLNHHRNCLLCHAPANTPDVTSEIVTGAVPIPGQPLSPQAQGYDPQTSPDLLVRVDVTYLRQDFSLLQPVKFTAPWPQQQRFDFLVRTRAITADEAQLYRQWRRQRGPGFLAPHQQATLAALRGLTGLDVAEPTAQAWRAALGN